MLLFFASLCFFVVDFAVRNAEMLTNVPKRKKAVMCLLEKICVLETPFRRELQCCWPRINVNESTVRYIKQKKEIR